MKKSRFVKLSVVTVILTVSLSVFISPSVAKESLSPAIDVLASDVVFSKNGVKNSSVGFSAAEFDEALGVSRVTSITLLVLPDESDGILMLGKVPALANQIIARNKISELVFVPKGGSVKDADFVFGCISSGYPRVVSCNIKFSETLNFSPSAAATPFSAYSGVPMSGRLFASDPDGDALTFVIASSPTLGTLKMKDPSSGEFVYTPSRSGTDSFSFFATDKYGNRSETVSVSLNVKSAPDINYVDVSGELQHYALSLAERGIFVGRRVGKYSYFEPNETVSYSEFMIMATSARGIILPEGDGDVSSVLSAFSSLGFDSDGSLSVSLALDIASEICGEKIRLSDVADGSLTREAAAKIIYEML